MIGRTLILLLALGAPAVAQTLPDARFQPIAVPAPNSYRTANGEPGPDYWQQRVDYAISATLDPATHTITGSETITYGNNSPDTLPFLWLQLDQNLFAPGSQGAQAFPPDGRFGGGGFVGGYTISKVAAGGTPLRTRIVDTVMRVDLPTPLTPGATTTFTVDWSFRVPENGSDRMGRDGDLHLLAQWYPRLAVYDDLHGWNTLPYLGQGEFYLEYGDITAELTVPATYFVGATGELQNPETVLTATQRERLGTARRGGAVVHVVSVEELAKAGEIRPRTDGTLTWRFRAENVRDFAWAASPRFVWDAAGWNDVLIHALYRPEVASWREVAEMTRHSLQFYSDLLIPYPYPTATSVEGPVYGMEYPMVVFVAPEAQREGLFDVLDHEWGHTWFPMIVGTDERRYAWMDEGVNTFINQLSKKVYFPESEPELLTVAQYAGGARAVGEQPMDTRPDLFEGEGALGIAGYIKPAVMLNALRALAGAEPFDAALAEYTRTWAYRHPQPADFYRFLGDELGLELGWFWHNWIETTATSDVAILGVDQGQTAGLWRVTVSVDMRGDLVMPAQVVATTATGATDTVIIPAEAFHGTDRATATLTLPGKAIRIAVNGGPEWGDVNPQNNTWGR